MPRLLASVVGVLVLTVYFSILAIAGCFATAYILGSPSLSAMLSGLTAAIDIMDLPLYVLKGGGCGLLVGWLCCHFGLLVRGSSTEVPAMTGRAVIRALLGCVLFNFAVTIGYYAWVSKPFF
jgi:ABC-type transporter Mla maintaining outer membrane lipid asymmetry permease subunit MlaE